MRITGLTDVNFATVSLTTDSIRSQSICAFSNSATDGYSVQAIGSGAGGAFTLDNGGSKLSYEAQWSDASSQSSGISLTPNIPQTGFTSIASQQRCNSGPATSASLIVIIRSAAASSATAGDYSGTLTLVLAAE